MSPGPVWCRLSSWPPRRHERRSFLLGLRPFGSDPVDPGPAIGNCNFFFALVWRILLAPTGVFIGLFSMVPAAAVIPIPIAARFSNLN